MGKMSLFEGDGYCNDGLSFKCSPLPPIMKNFSEKKTTKRKTESRNAEKDSDSD